MAKKILLVEDESDLLKLLKYNLEKEGFKVSYATDGSLALAEMRRNGPDLVILDLILPGLDGLEICRQLRRNEKFASIRSSFFQPEARKPTAWSASSWVLTITSPNRSACGK